MVVHWIISITEGVLATGAKYWVGSHCGSTPNRTVALSLTIWKTKPIANWPVLPPNTRHFNITTAPPIQFLSSVRIITWSICRLCSSSRSFTSGYRICDQTNIRWVAIEYWQISHESCSSFTPSQRISVGSQIWKRELKEQQELHTLDTDHVMIQWELENLIAAQSVGTVMLDHNSENTRPKNRRSMSVPGNRLTKTKRVGFLARSGTEMNWTTAQ